MEARSLQPLFRAGPTQLTRCPETIGLIKPDFEKNTANDGVPTPAGQSLARGVAVQAGLLAVALSSGWPQA